MVVHIYRAISWSGEFGESEEMKPRWWPHPDIPYNQMWPDNQFWLHHVSNQDRKHRNILLRLKHFQVLEGRRVRGYFLYNDCSSIARHSVEVVGDLPL